MKNFIYKLFAAAKDGLSEDNGHVSNMRINLTVIVITLTLSLAFGFVWTVINYKELIIPFATIIVSLIFAAAGLKAYQKTKEERVDSDAPPVPGATP